MTKREANKLLAYYCPFIKQQFKKEFKRVDLSSRDGRIFYTNGATSITSTGALSTTLTFIQNIRLAAIDYYKENLKCHK